MSEKDRHTEARQSLERIYAEIRKLYMVSRDTPNALKDWPPELPFTLGMLAGILMRRELLPMDDP